jgi:hypothetical protein
MLSAAMHWHILLLNSFSSRAMVLSKTKQPMKRKRGSSSDTLHPISTSPQADGMKMPLQRKVEDLVALALESAADSTRGADDDDDEDSDDNCCQITPDAVKLTQIIARSALQFSSGYSIYLNTFFVIFCFITNFEHLIFMFLSA